MDSGKKKDAVKLKLIDATTEKKKSIFKDYDDGNDDFTSGPEELRH